MKKIANSDILEVLRVDSELRYSPLMQNEVQVMDQRAKMAFALIQHWGAMATFGDIVSQFQFTETPITPVKQIPPSELVMRVCEVVDAGWSEMLHRGWIINVDSLGD